MARDKLITIRIEGEKREAFNNLAKSQNTDTASLLYDFISGCLDGRIDISLVTGKGNRLDKLDNQLDTNRLDKLETTTQRLDERLGQTSKKLNDWIESFSDRLSDCDRELTNRMISLEHRLNALAIQLDSQKDSQQLDSIDTDSQRIDDMEPLLKRERECSIATSPIVEPTGETSHDEPVTDAIETLTSESDSSIEGEDAIGPVPGDSIDTEPGKGKGMTAKDAAKYLRAKKVKVSDDSLHRWIRQEKIPNTSPQGKNAIKHLTLRAGLYYPIN